MDVQCGSEFLWFEEFEKKESQWAQERDQNDLTPWNFKPLFVEKDNDLGDYKTELRWPHAHASG